MYLLIGEWSKYGEERFMLHDNSNEIWKNIIIFATDKELQLLAEADSWFLDGNFELAPEFFKQLYVIRAQKKSIFITAVYCIVEPKTQTTYEYIFRTLIDECAKRNLYPYPLYMHLDFELAVINAAKSIFGTHYSFILLIRGCFYQICQSTYRKIQELGLSNTYKENENFRMFWSMIDSLAFLLLDKVREGMEYPKQNTHTDAEDILFYYD